MTIAPEARPREEKRATKEAKSAFGMWWNRYGNTVPTHLCRLRYFSGHGEWSVAFYTYRHERYEPSFFASGEALGTPEEGFDVGAVYLR